MDLAKFEVDGMSCGGCVANLTAALETLEGISSVEVEVCSAIVHHEGIDSGVLSSVISSAGFSSKLIPVANEGTDKVSEFNWGDRGVWKQSAHNTKWCLVGCSIGEFGTLAYYSFSGITSDLEMYSNMWYFYAILPLINGLATSVMLETVIMMRGQMDFRSALSTALGMSFISMLMMEIAMEITDLLFTQGSLGMNPVAIPFMLVVGFLTPWPYNYWRLKKYGKACC